LVARRGIACDAHGLDDVSVLSRVIFDTDVTPPSTPLGLTATAVSSSRIDLSWSASTDTGGSGVAGYDLLRDAITPIVIGVQTTYSDTGLTPSTSYSYRVRARDGNGNLGSYSSLSSATTQAASTTTSYSAFDALTADFIVDPARTTDGAGTEGSPFQPSQAFARNPNGQKLVFEWLPGNLDFTTSDPNSKFSRWHPLFSGTLANPIIHRCRFKASNASTTPAQLTSIRRTGGSGGILGVLGTDYCWFDGFNIPNWTGSSGAENFQYSVWGGRGNKFTRGVIDGQSLGVAGSSTNCGGVFHQDTDDCVVADTIVRNIGNSAGSSLWSAFESYGVDNLQIYNCTISNVHGFGIFEKGETTRFHPNRGNRFYRNKISSIRRRALFSYVHHTGTSLSDATWWYQNLVYDVQEQGFWINPIVGLPPDDIFLPWSGVVVVNNVFAFCGFDGLAWRHGGTISPEFAPIFQFRNNIFYANTKNIGFEGSTWATIAADAAQFDYNRYFGHTNHFEDSNGTRNFASWDDLIGYLGQRNDEHGQNADASFQNATGRDFRLATGSAARNAGTDYLSLLGGSSSAPINQGAYVTSDMSDSIGCRTNV
jgi:chitodextrinase